MRLKLTDGSEVEYLTPGPFDTSYGFQLDTWHGLKHRRLGRITRMRTERNGTRWLLERADGSSIVRHTIADLVRHEYDTAVPETPNPNP